MQRTDKSSANEKALELKNDFGNLFNTKSSPETNCK